MGSQDAMCAPQTLTAWLIYSTSIFGMVRVFTPQASTMVAIMPGTGMGTGKLGPLSIISGSLMGMWLKVE